MKADPDEWHRTSPLAAVFYLGRIYEAIAKNAVQSLAPLAAFLVAFEGDPMNKVLFGVSAFVLVTLVMAFMRYWVFRYRIGGNSVLIRDGVFNKKQLDIRFERIQGINTTRNVLDRLFDLVTVSFDTAGSTGQEGHLPAVPLQLSRELRDRISRNRPEEDEALESEPERARTLLRLGGGDMVRIGLSSDRVFLILVLLGPLSEILDLELRTRVEESALLEVFGAATAGLLPGVTLVVAIVLAVLLLLFAGSVVGAFLRYHRYELAADEHVLRSAGGLFTRHEHSVDRSKIQSLQVIQNVVLRAFGRFRLRVRQAASSGSGGQRDFVVPLCTMEDLPAIGREVFGEEFRRLALDPRAPDFERVSPLYLRSRTMLIGVLPAIAATLALFPEAGPAALAVLLWIPLAAAITWQKYRRLGVLVTGDGLALRSGFAGHRVAAHLHRKVQKVVLGRSPFQRRKGIANLHIHLAAGSVKIPYLELTAATRLRDFILYRVESSTRPWH